MWSNGCQQEISICLNLLQGISLVPKCSCLSMLQSLSTSSIHPPFFFLLGCPSGYLLCNDRQDWHTVNIYFSISYLCVWSQLKMTALFIHLSCLCGKNTAGWGRLYHSAQTTIIASNEWETKLSSAGFRLSHRKHYTKYLFSFVCYTCEVYIPFVCQFTFLFASCSGWDIFKI